LQVTFILYGILHSHFLLRHSEKWLQGNETALV